jgi:hypothetical protein
MCRLASGEFCFIKLGDFAGLIEAGRGFEEANAIPRGIVKNRGLRAFAQKFGGLGVENNRAHLFLPR